MSRFLIVPLLVWGIVLAYAPSASAVTCESDIGSCEMGSVEYPYCHCAEHCRSTTPWVMLDDPAQETEEWCLEQMEEICAEEPAAQKEPLESCSNEKGYCMLQQHNSGIFEDCVCADGIGVSAGLTPDGDDGADGDAPEVDWEELNWNCEQKLAAQCPMDPADPSETCSAAALPVCERIEELRGACDHHPVLAFHLIDCCEEFEENPTAALAHRDCLEASECIDYACCSINVPMGAPASGNSDAIATGDSGNPSDGDESNDNAAAEEIGDDGSDGCRQTHSAMPWLLVWLLAALTLRRPAVCRNN